jgi:hypothetical protein
VCSAVGLELLRRCNAQALGRRSDRFALAIWLGAATLSAVLLTVALFVPLSPAAAVSALAVATAGALRSEATRAAWRHSWRLGIARSACVAVLATAMAALVAQPVTWYDTGLYHYGVIQWLQRYGEVPGLALVHMRFGQISSWFALSAVLDAGGWERRMVAAAGGFVALLALAHALACGGRALASRGTTQDWFAFLLLPITALVVRTPVAASPSPDVPVLLLTGVVAWAVLLVAAQERATGGVPAAPAADARLVPVILAAGAVAMKLSAVPLLAVAPFFYWRGVRPTPARFVTATGVAVAFLLPLGIAGVITSGCPLYPSPVGCLDLPWGVGAAHAREYSAVIRQWAQWAGPTPAGATAWQWTGPWIAANRVVVALVFASALSVPLLLWKRAAIPGTAWVVAVTTVGLLFVAVTAPADRFLFAYALLLPALLGASYAHRLWHPAAWLAVRPPSPASLDSRLFAALAVASAIALAGLARTRAARGADPHAASTPTGRAEFPLLTPSRLRMPPVTVRFRAGAFDYVRPLAGGGEDRCWAAPQPCTPQLTHPNVSLRDPARGLRGGFRLTTLPPER